MATGEPPTLHPGPDVPISVRARGWILAAILGGSALLGSFYILFPLTPLIFLHPRAWRLMCDRLVGFWVAMPGALMEYLFGARVSVIGHRIEHAEPGLIIMNHRTRLDWLYFWTALYKVDPWLLVSEKISLKGILRYVPGAGWAMQSASFIFLDRAFHSDKTKMERLLDYYANSGFNYQLLLFPEGTDKCPLATARSEKHATEKSLVHYDYLLHARTTGFVHMVQRMRKNGYIKWLYDVTIGYDDAIVQSEVHLITHGLAPQDVHYQVIALPISSLPESDDGLADWITKRWAEKEEKLKDFYKRDRAARPTFDMPDGGKEYKLTPALAHGRYFIILFWTMIVVGWTYFAFTVKQVALIAVLASAFFGGCQKIYGGVEWLAVTRQEIVLAEEKRLKAE